MNPLRLLWALTLTMLPVPGTTAAEQPIELKTITGTLSSGEDVSEQRKLERELSQAHKLEAVGRLAAGASGAGHQPSGGLLLPGAPNRR